MLVKRKYLRKIMEIISKGENKIFNIQAQYNLIKLKRAIQPELEIIDQQIESLSPFFDTDENGQLIYSSTGGVKIKEDCIEECNRRIREMEEMEISLPDIYFSLEDLEPIGLTLSDVEALEFCIK